MKEKTIREIHEEKEQYQAKMYAGPTTLDETRRQTVIEQLEENQRYYIEHLSRIQEKIFFLKSNPRFTADYERLFNS